MHWALHPWLVHGVPGDVKPPSIHQELLNHIRVEAEHSEERREKAKEEGGEEKEQGGCMFTGFIVLACVCAN
jgi:hypothetical protein